MISIGNVTSGNDTNINVNNTINKGLDKLSLSDFTKELEEEKITEKEKRIVEEQLELINSTEDISKIKRALNVIKSISYKLCEGVLAKLAVEGLFI